MLTDNRHSRAHTDIFTILLVAALCIFGILAVSVATYTTSSTSDTPLLNHIVESSYALRQCLFVLIAPVIATLIMNIPYDFMRRITRVLYYFMVSFLAFTWLTNQAEGVKAWMDIIWGYTIQPSEFAKLTLILRMAQIFADREKPMSDVKDFLFIMGSALLPMLVILASGEMGSMLVMGVIFAVMLFFSGVSWRVFGGLVLAFVLFVAAIYGFAVATGSDSYRLQRILAFIDPAAYSSSDAYQQLQSKTAIGSGGLSGIGQFVDGAWSQLNYVPADWTDFIFASIGEAWGFIGCVGILIVYLVLILRMMWLSFFTVDKFGRLIILGVMAMLFFHVFENIAMTIGLMPITGIPLPFISYGGSNMVTNIAGVGLVLNVTRNRSVASSIPTPQRVANTRKFYSKW